MIIIVGAIAAYSGGTMECCKKVMFYSGKAHFFVAQSLIIETDDLGLLNPIVTKKRFFAYTDLI